MKGGTGDLKVEAKVTSYRKDVLLAENVSDYVSSFVVLRNKNACSMINLSFHFKVYF